LIRAGGSGTGIRQAMERGEDCFFTPFFAAALDGKQELQDER
jgi:hypothetical protein